MEPENIFEFVENADAIIKIVERSDGILIEWAGAKDSLAAALADWIVSEVHNQANTVELAGVKSKVDVH